MSTLLFCLGEPDVVHKLIAALGLGSSGHHISPGPPPFDGITNPGDNRTHPTDRFGRSVCEEAEKVCRGITVPPRRRGELAFLLYEYSSTSLSGVTSVHITALLFFTASLL